MSIGLASDRFGANGLIFSTLPAASSLTSLIQPRDHS
jgi:hypothetical protein